MTSSYHIWDMITTILYQWSDCINDNPMSVTCNIIINGKVWCWQFSYKWDLNSFSHQCDYIIDVDSMRINLQLSLIETEPPNIYKFHVIISMWSYHCDHISNIWLIWSYQYDHINMIISFWSYQSYTTDMIILMSSFQFQYDHVNVILMSNMKQWLLKLKLNFDNGAIDRRRLIRTFSACWPAGGS